MSLQTHILLLYAYSSSMTQTQETRALFEAYVGAVFAQSDMGVIIRWISRLVDPNSTTSDHGNAVEYEEYRPVKRTRTQTQTNVKTEDATPEYGLFPAVPTQPSGFSPDSVYTGAPTVNTYAIPASPPSKQPMPSIKVTYLPAFNERCSQRHLRVDYESSNTGLPHAPRWVMKCYGEYQ